MRPDRGMAIPRMLNSNTPFIIVAGGSELSFLGKEDDDGQGCEEEKDSLVQAIAPHLSRVMQLGTAKQVVLEGHEENPCVSIVAQAEREDFQEFSPTNTQSPYSRSQLLQKHRPLSKEAAVMSDTEDEDVDKLQHYHLQRKQRRKPRAQQNQEEGEEPPIIRGLWVQEIDWLKSTSAEIIPPPPQFTDSADLCMYEDECDCVRRLEESDQLGSADPDDTSSSEDRGSDSDCSLDCESVCTHESESDSSFCLEADVQDRLGVEANASNSTFDLMHVSGFNSSSHAEWDSGSTECLQSLLGVSDHAFPHSSVSVSGCDDTSHKVFDELRGKVTKIPKLFVSAFHRGLIKQILNDWKSTKPANEGLIFHHQLQPNTSRYREGEEYCVLRRIQNGSYGDVFCVRDNSTGFRCAAKRVSQERVSQTYPDTLHPTLL
nr:PREDICTED: uncharacterized protein LOC103369530 [Stegastes partitus]